MCETDKLGHRGDVVAWTPHLCEHFVQPLQGAVQVHLYPAGGGGHVLENIHFKNVPTAFSYFRAREQLASFNGRCLWFLLAKN